MGEIILPAFSGISIYDIRDAHSIHPRAYIATAFSPHVFSLHGSGTAGHKPQSKHAGSGVVPQHPLSLTPGIHGENCHRGETF